MLQAHLTGVFPRSEQLIEITRAAERGGASKAQLDDAFKRDIISLIELQGNAGLDFVVDGQLNWQDLFRPFSKLLTGIELGGLTRWFDNNTFYRKPIIADKVRLGGSSPGLYFRGDLLPSTVRKKAILPGPYTFAAMSQNIAYASFADLVDDLAHALKDCLRELGEAGYEYFQFNEPCLSLINTGKPELEVAKSAYEVCTKGCGAKTCLHVYFGNAGPVIGELLDFPSDSLGLDFYATSIESICEYDLDKELGCGCIDGRNSLLESPSDLRKLLDRIEEEVCPKGLFLCPNCDLEFLPYPVAEKKIRILSETKKLVA